MGQSQYPTCGQSSSAPTPSRTHTHRQQQRHGRTLTDPSHRLSASLRFDPHEQPSRFYTHPDICRSCYTLMAHRHMDTESHSRPVARCPARMLRHTADHRPATNHASGRFLPQESVTWIKKRTKRRCCWRNAVKGFSCSRDRSSLSCAPAPRTSNTIPPRSTCMATVRPNRPNHSLRDSEPIFWQQRLRYSRVFEPCAPLMFSRSSKRAETRHKRWKTL